MPAVDYTPLFEAAGKQYNVDPTLLRAVSTVESGGNPRAVSPAGALGLMQLMPDTAKSLGVTDPYDPTQAIPAAARLLAENMDRYKNPADALRAYNAGTDQSRWNNPETQSYVPKIIAAFKGAVIPSASAAEPTGGKPFVQAPPTESGQPADAFSAVFGAPKAPASPDGVTTITVTPHAPAEDASGHTPAVADALARAAQASATPGAPVAPGAPAAGGDAFSAVFGGGSAPQTPAVPTAAPQAAAPTPSQAPTVMQEIGAGLDRFGHDVTDTPAELLARGGTALANKLGIKLPAPTGAELAASDASARNAFNQQYGGSPIAQGVRLAGDVGTALAPAGLVGRGIGAAGEAAFGAENPLARFATSALSGAGAGAAGAAVTSGASDQPLGNQMLGGAEFGGALGAAAPVAAAAGRGIRNAFTGANIPRPVAELAQTARNTYDIPIQGGQISTSPAVRFLDSVTKRLPFSGAGAAAEGQQTAFNRAVARSFGEDAEHITPEVMASAKTRLGNTFDAIAAKTTVHADDQLLSDLGRIQSEATQTLPASEQVPINAQLTNVLEAATKGDGAIDGPTYQALTRKGAPLDRAMQAADPNVRFYAGQVRSALDDALQRSAPPELQAQLRQARTQYKAMKTVEDLVEKSPTGDISPSLLMGRVRASYGNMAYDGGGDLGTLARIGQQFLKEAPSSGTAERSLLHGMLFETPAMITGNPLLGAKIAGGIAAGRLAGSVLRSGPYTNMLLRGALRDEPGVVTRFAQGALPQLPTTGSVLLQRNPLLVGGENRQVGQ